MNVSELVEAHALQLRADGRSVHSISQVRRHGLLFARWLAAERVDDNVAKLDPPVVARFLASPAATRRPDGKPKLPASVNALRTSVRCLMKFAHDSGFAMQDAARLVRRAHCTMPPPRALPAADIAKLLAALAQATGRAGQRDHALFHLLSATGLRIGSALGLEVEHVDLVGGVLRIETAKGNARGRVFLNPRIRDHLRSFVGERTTGPLFESKAGERLCTRQAQARMARWLERAAVQRKASPHSLRHSFATELLARTGDLALVQAALLHASIGSTTRYARVDEGRLRASVGA
jgi:site-specific recombinase XerD